MSIMEKEVNSIKKNNPEQVIYESETDGGHTTFFETDDDYKFSVLKSVCFDYLDGVDLTYMDNSSIIKSYDFLGNKMDELLNLQRVFSITPESLSFFNIEQTMAMFTLSEDMHSPTEETINSALSNEINSTLDQIGFTFGIIQKIMQERNLIDQE